MRHGIKTFFFLFTLTILSGCATLTTTFRKEKTYTVAFYNVDNLFDPANDPKTADDDFTPQGEMKWDKKRYDNKLKHIKAVIESMGEKGGPAILGLAEVESRQVVQDIVNTASLRNKTYGIIHYDSPDRQGLDVALLYRPKIFKPTAQRSIPIDFPGDFRSRDILQVSGLLEGEPVTILVTHWPASNGNPKLNESRRRAAAAALRKQIDAVQKADKQARILVMGDFEDEPRSANIEQVLKATGRPNPYYADELYNAFYLSYIQGLGSYFQRGDFRMPDQIMLSKSWIDGKGLQYVRGSATIHDPEFSKFTLGKYKDTPRRTYANTLYLDGYSDHFPVYIKVQKVR
ncbi:endonuclease/exonuclease/phosphatase family protein [Pontibacter ruber]|uniref:Endonuclease/exonuclease/phosphatase family protein n=1 Tax=Pontibacter ruber TaxID=1343895 RepID=A0ABW5CYY6_9BACT|nr:endonuclease/exonuclease/phosphatase family protein [Pontibacter ruber]